MATRAKTEDLMDLLWTLINDPELMVENIVVTGKAIGKRDEKIEVKLPTDRLTCYSVTPADDGAQSIRNGINTSLFKVCKDRRIFDAVPASEPKGGSTPPGERQQGTQAQGQNQQGRN